MEEKTELAISEKLLSNPKFALTMLSSYIGKLEASEQARIAAEQKLEIKEQEVQTMRHELETTAPKVTFYNAVTQSGDWIDMSTAVKTLNLGVGRNTAFRLLRDYGILANNNEPYQEYVDRGCFRLVEEVFENAYGETMVNYKPVVSPKGIDLIRRVILTEQKNNPPKNKRSNG